MTRAPWLIDKSALVRMPDSRDVDEWNNRVRRGLVRIATVTLLEVGYSARSAEGHRSALTTAPIALMPVEHATPAAERRAVEVQGMLAARGHHRGPSVPDLIIAAVAEHARLTVLHVDRDFELIAEVTGQPVARLAVS
ncbi:PIN domain nuclease [Tomitella gaofuii]|uniref:PIN domain nuclease n=1 Tax=Tomitella gaofuii TaxID=2760083 RepID=UPI0015FAAE13|nr:PIN domain nuclease [Tomitella gaofuii]